MGKIYSATEMNLHLKKKKEKPEAFAIKCKGNSYTYVNSSP